MDDPVINQVVVRRGSQVVDRLFNLAVSLQVSLVLNQADSLRRSPQPIPQRNRLENLALNQRTNHLCNLLVGLLPNLLISHQASLVLNHQLNPVLSLR